jgi:heat shock protein HtpX
MALSAVGLNTYIWNNNFKSILLLAAFPLLLLAMMWVGAYCYFFPEYSEKAIDLATVLVQENWFFVFAGVTMWFIVAWCFHEEMINSFCGAVIAKRKDQEKIYNLLENLCISRGVNMPKLAIIPSNALNAFASGISKSSYTITLTEGLIKTLNDEELEAVLGHELTHIINRDVRLLIIAVIFVGILGFLAELVLRSRSGSGKKDGRLKLIAVVVLFVGYFIAILMRFALSRKREYLADAGSVEMTKNPDAMISALQKISGHAKVEGMSKDVAQMCIENPRTSFFGLFSTHPAMKNRIAALEKFAGSHLK